MELWGRWLLTWILRVLTKKRNDLNLIDTGRKLNVHKTFIRLPGRVLNVLCTFSLRPVSAGKPPEI